ncbi:MAG: GatB/YqeY domain-containing protein [Betaproteobacteria bacterium]|nr:GatB/YqeY domain-containing protein [Betaproteobacteria bacterium]
MSVAQRIADDLRSSLKAGDKPRLAVLRMLKAAIDKERIDSATGEELAEPAVIAVLRRQHKQRLEAAKMLADGGAAADAERERSEAVLIEQYLPQMLGAEAIAERVEAAIDKTSAATPADLGKVMGMLKGELAGVADMGQVAAAVRKRLAG